MYIFDYTRHGLTLLIGPSMLTCVNGEKTLVTYMFCQQLGDLIFIIITKHFIQPTNIQHQRNSLQAKSVANMLRLQYKEFPWERRISPVPRNSLHTKRPAIPCARTDALRLHHEHAIYTVTSHMCHQSIYAKLAYVPSVNLCQTRICALSQSTPNSHMCP